MMRDKPKHTSDTISPTAENVVKLSEKKLNTPTNVNITENPNCIWILASCVYNRRPSSREHAEYLLNRTGFSLLSTQSEGGSQFPLN